MESYDYILIQAPMVKDLRLSGNRLIVYALIHGFCKDGNHEFKGSISYISEWTNLSRNTVISTLKSLVDDGLIVKRDYLSNGVKFCAYSIGGSAKIAPLVQIVDVGSAKIAPNNTNDNIIINKEHNNIIENNKEKENSQKEKKKDELFEQCWIAYKRKGSKKKSKEYWCKLSDKEKDLVLPHIKSYVASRDLQFQKDFERYLRDKIYLTIVYQGNNVLYDPTRGDESQPYSPQTGFSLNWNDYYKCFMYTGYWDGHIPDGYSDEERPDGAKVTLNNGRGIVTWSKQERKWIKK